MHLDLSDPRLKISLLLGLPVLWLFAWAWLAGIIFMEATGFSWRDAGPTTTYQYWYHYWEIKNIRLWLIVSWVISFALLAMPLALYFKPKGLPLYGDATWACSRDIVKSGLYSEDGIIVGQKKSKFGFPTKYLIFGGAQHVLMAAPTRSGKGVGVVIPNLLSFKGSVVVLDIKQENWDITAGFRASHGQACYLLNLAPRDYRSHRWNPLSYISDDENFRINDIQKIGQMLFPRIDGDAPIWQASARSLWLGIILYLIETDELPVTLGEALRQVVMGDDILQEKVKARQASDNKLSEPCYLALNEYFDTPHKTRGSVRKGFTSALELLYNPVIDAVTAGNDFDLRDLRKKPMTIYISILLDDLARLAPLINLFFQQLISLNTQELPEKHPEFKHQCLLLMDEFVSMGKLDVLSEGIAFIAGYGLRMLPIIQSPAQLRKIYGADTTEAFTDNHALKIVFTPNNAKVAKEISENLGTTTVKSKSKTRQLVGRSGRSESASDHGRALLLPQEIVGMGQDAEIVLLENCPPILCDKIVWYKDKMFSDRGNGRDGMRWRTPKVPTIDPKGLVKGKVTYANDKVERNVTFEDVENMDNIPLSDFPYDFSDVIIPQGEGSEAAINSAKEYFVSIFRPSKIDAKAPDTSNSVARNITFADVENMDNIPLSDFPYDFSDVIIAQGDATEEIINSAKECFVSKFQPPKEA